MIRANFTKFVAVPLSCVVLVSMSAAIQGQTAPAKKASKAKAAKVVLDLNTATADELEAELPGVGPTTAKKIVAGRPYTKVEDLVKAGISRRVIEGFEDQVKVGTAMADSPKTTKSTTAKGKGTPSKETAGGKVNLNTADVAALEELPGIGPATAKAIVDGRPWKSVEELDKIKGLGKARIAALREHVTFGDDATPAVAKAKPKAEMPKETAGGKVNLNSADITALESLPGVGPATAKAIVEGRPWKSVDDLTKIRGLGETKLAALKELITLGDEPAPASAKTTPVRTAGKTTAATSTATKAMPKLQPGRKVNINTASKDELDVLPGIGPVKAQAIIDGRPFKTIEDIKTVKGIKDGEFSKIQDLISVQ